MQQEIITTLDVAPTIAPLEEAERRSQFLAEYLGQTGLNGFVLGISGGQDSLLAGLLAQRAVDIHRQNGHSARFHAALLPYKEQRDRLDAELAIDTISPDITHDLNIQAGVDGMADAYAISEGYPMRDFDKGNVKARMRMIAQYALASEYGLLVIGSDHAAEAVTGFYTKFGDGGADILPLAGLTKRQGRSILESLAVPEVFTTKQPTADLLDAAPGQTDENELGISYDALDDYLEGKTIDHDSAAKIEARYIATQHKRNTPVAYRAVSGNATGSVE